MGGAVWMGEKGEGSTKLQHRHGDVKSSIGNRVSNMIITMYGAKWVLELSGRSLHTLHDCLTATILY